MIQNDLHSITWKITLGENPFYFRYGIVMSNIFSLIIIYLTFFFLAIPIWVKLAFIGCTILSLPIIILLQKTRTLEITIDNDGIKTLTKFATFKRKTYASWDMLKNSILKVEYNDEYKGIIIFTSYFGEKTTTFSPLRHLFLRASSYIFLPVIDKTSSVEPIEFIKSKIK